MSPGEAQQLLARLSAGYPHATLNAPTVNLWINELRPLEFPLGQRAVHSLLHGCRFFPTIAELNEHLSYAREADAREHRATQTHAARTAEDQLPRVPLRQMPQVTEFIGRLQSDAPVLTLTDPGDCDDCGTTGARFTIGRLKLCHRDAGLRARAGDALLETNVRLAERWVRNHGTTTTIDATEAELGRQLPGDEYMSDRHRLLDLAADLKRDQEPE